MHSGLILLLSAWALACAASAEPSADVSAAAGLRALAADGEEALLRTCASILSSKNGECVQVNCLNLTLPRFQRSSSRTTSR